MEKELLLQLRELKSQRYSLEAILTFTNNEEERIKISLKLKEISLTMTEIFSILEESTDSEYFRGAQETIVKYFGRIISELETLPQNAFVTRDQSSMDDDAFFHHLNKDLSFMIEDGHRGILGRYFIYSFSEEKTLKCSKLIENLKKEVQIITELSPRNFNALLGYLNEFGLRFPKIFDE